MYSSKPCSCEECGTLLDTKVLSECIEKKKPVTCPKCGHKMPVRGADAEIREFHPKAIGVINDSHGTDFSEKDVDKDSMMVFKCMTCGAGLDLTADTKRTIMCRYCDNENYLPDNIWGKLHPNREVQPLYVLLDITEDDIKGSIDYFLRVTALSVYSKHFDNFIKEFFEKPFTDEALLIWFKHLLSAGNNEKVSFNMDITKIQRHFYDNLMLGISSHPVDLKCISAEFGEEIPADLQIILSDDKDKSVRLSLAKNINLRKDVIRKLQKDPDPAVSGQAAKQKSGFFGKLFG
jgi:DNA-directed RNA polymerase subunit RPC12/RpoP